MLWCCGRWNETDCPCLLEHPVRGSSAFDKSLNTYLELPTRTDALLASLLITLNIGESEFAKVLSIVRDPGFDAREVTLNLNSVEDYFVSVKRARYAQLNEIMQQSLSSVPQVVVDGALEAIADTIEDEEKDRDFIHRIPLFSMNDIKNISLIQRNWVLPARRILGGFQCLQHSNKKTIGLEMLRHPLTGPWTQNIDLVLSKSKFSYSQALDFCTVVQRLAIRHLPALRSLSLMLHATTKDENKVASLMHTLGQITSLEDLRVDIESAQSQSSLMPNAWFVRVTSMTRLKRFTFRSHYIVKNASTSLSEALKILRSAPSLVAFTFSGDGGFTKQFIYTRRLPEENLFRLHGLRLWWQRWEEPTADAYSYSNVRSLTLKMERTIDWDFGMIAKASNVCDVIVELHTESSCVWDLIPSSLPLSLQDIVFVCNVNDTAHLQPFEGAGASRIELGEKLRTRWADFDRSLAARVKAGAEAGRLHYMRVEVNFFGTRGEQPEDFDLIDLPASSAACRNSNPQVKFGLQKLRKP